MKYYIEEFDDYIYIDTNWEYLVKQSKSGNAVILITDGNDIPGIDYSLFPDILELEEEYFKDNGLKDEKSDSIQDLLNDEDMRNYFFESYCRQQKIPLTVTQDEVLRIREFAMSDLEKICEIYESDLGRRFLEPFYQSQEEAHAYLKDYINYVYPVNSYCLWVTELVSDASRFYPQNKGKLNGKSKIIGIVGITEDNNSVEDGSIKDDSINGNLELKFALHPDYYGQGYGEKMCRLAMDYTMRSLEFEESEEETRRNIVINAYFHSENCRCKKLLAKLGFKLGENSASLPLLW